MADPAQIPYLLELLDDESAAVRTQVLTALRGYGDQLERIVVPYVALIEGVRRSLLTEIIQSSRETRFRDRWPAWLEISDPYTSLEHALESLSLLEAAWGAPTVSELLDELAAKFRRTVSEPYSIEQLNYFVFVTERYRPPAPDYYHPNNSNLTEVLRSRRGIQISLSCLVILLAYRLGILMVGCNLPGHFLYMMGSTGQWRVFDPFNLGLSLPDNTRKYLETHLQQHHTDIPHPKNRIKPFSLWDGKPCKE
jgi:regulator of sirC expression with transglutaminase-like and TPR domain